MNENTKPVPETEGHVLDFQEIASKADAPELACASLVSDTTTYN